MGATKRCAELATLAAATSTFRPIVLRFGNILGSSGSVVEIMGRCIQQGKNIPITDPTATRFFMTASEAVSLVLKADLMAREPEVFWLDMGEPIAIGALAERFIAHATPAGQPRVGIDVIGLRPGEKIHEELTTHGLQMRPTAHPRIRRARQRELPRETTRTAVRDIRSASVNGDVARVIAALQRAVSDFIPSSAAVEAAHSQKSQKGKRAWGEHVRLSAVAVAS
jgi:FlaA1/EpsC-like NDP-sugar epimerase